MAELSDTIEAIAAALGVAVPDSGSSEYVQWVQWINDAKLLIRVRLGELAELDQDVLDYVVREAVVLHIRRPDDATRVEVRVDDAATSRTYTSGSGRITILDEWWRLLTPSAAADSGAFSVTPYFAPDVVNP